MSTLQFMLMIYALLQKIQRNLSTFLSLSDGPLTYHLGADYFHDPDGMMICQPKKYIDKLKESYIRLFNTEPPKGLK